MSDSLKKAEERKRAAAYDPATRWKHIQEAIAWAERNMKPEFRRNRPRTRKETGNDGQSIPQSG